MMSIVRDYQKFREWAEALAKDNPHGIGESLIEYADAWDRDLIDQDKAEQCCRERAALRDALRAMVAAQHAGPITQEMYDAWEAARALLSTVDVQDVSRS